LKDRYLITSALPYINGVKHLGNLAGSMLPADVHARFRRMHGAEVLFICATDEHGTPAELAAVEAGCDVRAYCDEQHAVQKVIYDRFRLSFDWFGRSSNTPNHRLTQHFCDQLERNGYIEERVTKQIYSPDDGRFLPDRYVEGTCPHCGFERARGDQCDGCGSLLEPAELKNPRSKVSGSTRLELRDTAHLFLLQSKLADRIGAWVESAEHWPALARSIAFKWLDEGLKDRAITRDLSWGVPVTQNGRVRSGFESKVFYVWFDAPIEYIGATQEWAEATGNDWARWWRTDQGADNVIYTQFMGKDNVAFHTVSFPATILGAGEPWKLVDRLKALNWVTWYGGKFSTSEKSGVFMDQALELLPADYWRWYLMAHAPESSDASFTWEHLRSTINADLADTLGNFINRVIAFCKSRFDGQVPDGETTGPFEDSVLSALDERLRSLARLHDQMEFRKAAAETRAIWSLGNEYLTSSAPWTAIQKDPHAAATSIRLALEMCVLFADIGEPFIPDASDAIRWAFGIAAGSRSWPTRAADRPRLITSQPVSSPGILFRKIEEADVTTWAQRFRGG
jgi:methionyl-tRNA synthetase